MGKPFQLRAPILQCVSLTVLGFPRRKYVDGISSYKAATEAVLKIQN